MDSKSGKLNFWRATSLIFAALFVGIAILNYTFAWTNPSQSPPNGGAGAIPVTSGGTGATTTTGALSNLGAAAKGANSDITSLTGLTTPLGIAYGGTGLSSAGTSGNVLTSNGTSWASSAPSGGAPFSNVQAFTSGNTFTVPSGVTKLWVEVYGAGGGGAGSNGGSAYGSGGGGGAGGVAMGFLTVTPSQQITVTVGSGGTAGGSGGTGNTSSFSTLSATGGSGGAMGDAGGWGGAGGTGSGGSINQSGGAGGGGGGTAGASAGGSGGSNTRGGGGRGSSYAGGGGVAGSVYGGGGGGTAGTSTGGAGGGGGVIVWW